MAEVLAAMVFMAIVIPVTLQGIRIATRAGEFGVRKDMAAQVARMVLDEIAGTRQWNNMQTSGTESIDHYTFHWQLKDEVWQAPIFQTTLRLYTVVVDYSVSGQTYQLSLSTVVDTTIQ